MGKSTTHGNKWSFSIAKIAKFHVYQRVISHEPSLITINHHSSPTLNSNFRGLPSDKHTTNYGKSQCSMAKPTTNGHFPLANCEFFSRSGRSFWQKTGAGQGAVATVHPLWLLGKVMASRWFMMENLISMDDD